MKCNSRKSHQPGGWWVGLGEFLYPSALHSNHSPAAISVCTKLGGGGGGHGGGDWHGRWEPSAQRKAIKKWQGTGSHLRHHHLVQKPIKTGVKDVPWLTVQPKAQTKFRDPPPKKGHRGPWERLHIKWFDINYVRHLKYRPFLFLKIKSNIKYQKLPRL